MVGRQVVAEVEQVVAAIVRRVDHVGVLDERQEGDALALGQADPVLVRGQLAVQRDGEHHGAHAVEPAKLAQVVGGQVGRQPLHQFRAGRAEHAVEGLRLTAGHHVVAAAGPWVDGLDGRAGVELRALAADAAGQVVDKGLEAAVEVGELGRACIDARPEPGQVDLLVIRAELALQLEFPCRLVGLAAHLGAQPFVGQNLVEVAPRLAGMVTQVADDHAHAHAVDKGDEREAQHARDAVQRVVLPLRVDGGVGPVALERVGKADLVEQAEHGAVGEKEVVIVVLKRPLPLGAPLEAGGQPAQVGRALEERHSEASLHGGPRQVVGGGQTGDAAANDGDALQAGRL